MTTSVGIVNVDPSLFFFFYGLWRRFSLPKRTAVHLCPRSGKRYKVSTQDVRLLYYHNVGDRWRAEPGDFFPWYNNNIMLDSFFIFKFKTITDITTFRNQGVYLHQYNIFARSGCYYLLCQKINV